jgi:choline dehydrogenase-like flavoprotein
MLIGHEADVCVIGSGVAGALVAYRCASRGARVLLLEAGPRFDRAKRLEQMRRYLLLGQDPWPEDPVRDAYVNSSDFQYPLNRYRLRAVGGSTLHWSGIAQRLRPSDFQTRSRYGLGVDWPISYDDLERYYLGAEQELGVSGEPAEDGPARSGPFPMPAFPDGYGDALWRRAGAALGIRIQRESHARNNLVQYDGRPPCATFATCTICPIGAQYSADWHVAKAERTGRCTLLADTVVRRLEADSTGRIRTVHATARDGTGHEVRATSVVLAAHAIESARLLLLSKLGNPDHVGRNLMEHWERIGTGRGEESGYPMRVGYPALTSFHYYDAAERDRRGAIKVEFRDAVNPHTALGRDPGLWGPAMAEYDCENFGRLRSLQVVTEHLPNPESRVTLDPAAVDRFGDPAPNIRFVLSEVDRVTLERGRAVLGEILGAAGLQNIQIREDYHGSAHHMGTCRMSATPEGGVVDRDSRVHGTPNLFVAGSAVFPTGGGVGPTLTIAALALRLADHLAARP